jgi:hypothetical protein
MITWRHRRSAGDKTLKVFSEKVSSLEARIDLRAVNKEEFSELFESCRMLAGPIVVNRNCVQPPI